MLRMMFRWSQGAGGAVVHGGGGGLGFPGGTDENNITLQVFFNALVQRTLQ